MRKIFTEETRDQLLKNPLNNSTSKASWSFGKQTRFKGNKKQCPHVAYDINLSTNSKRKTTFGYGKRTSFVLENKFTPDPMKYSISRPKSARTSGCNFGASRQDTINISSSYIPLEQLKNPGPSDYQQKSQYSERNNNKKGYTMRPNTAHERTYFIENKQLSERPGPGRYQVNGTMLETESSNVFSKFKYQGVPHFDRRTSKRFKDSNKNPGPGDYFKRMGYEDQSSISRNKSIGRQTRTSFTQYLSKSSFTPGPGSYKLPTDFGHYSDIMGL